MNQPETQNLIQAIKAVEAEIMMLRMERHPERSVKTKEAAVFLGISATNLRRIVQAGLLQPILLSEDMTFELEDLKRLRAEHKVRNESLLKILERKGKAA